jgi:RNA polymerase sigma-70 factor (ECF subfamily)
VQETTPPCDPLDDVALAERARSGDQDAYAALVRRHQAVALRLATLLGPAQDAEDACQEAFVKAFSALGRYDQSRPFRPWLLAIVANEARTRGRRSARAARLLERAAAMGPLPGSQPSAEEQVLARVGSGRLVAAFQGLRPDEQTTLALRFLLDLSERESASILGCRVGTVKSRTSRALRRLRAALEEPP